MEAARMEIESKDMERGINIRILLFFAIFLQLQWGLRQILPKNKNKTLVRASQWCDVRLPSNLWMTKHDSRSAWKCAGLKMWRQANARIKEQQWCSLGWRRRVEETGVGRGFAGAARCHASPDGCEEVCEPQILFHFEFLLWKLQRQYSWKHRSLPKLSSRRTWQLCTLLLLTEVLHKATKPPHKDTTLLCILLHKNTAAPPTFRFSSHTCITWESRKFVVFFPPRLNLPHQSQRIYIYIYIFSYIFNLNLIVFFSEY